MRIFLTTLAALLVAGGSGYYLLSVMRPAPEPAATLADAAEPQAQPVQVFVPETGLAAGTILVPEHLARLALDRDAVGDEMILADDEGRGLLVGSVARHALPRGVPIARSAVVQPGERGFLAAVLPQGKRAISIPIGETAGLSGLVMPGDRVDIILTYSVAGAAIEAERDIQASETVLANLRVLALDQRLQPADAAADGPEGRPIARSATLEVSPREAEMLTLATQLGDLALVLNSVKDGGEPSGLLAETVLARAETGRTRDFTLDSQVTSLLQRQPRAPAAAAGPTIVAAPAPTLAERLSRVQVVRGIRSQAMQLGTVEAAADPGVASLVQPVRALAPAAPPNPFPD